MDGPAPCLPRGACGGVFVCGALLCFCEKRFRRRASLPLWLTEALCRRRCGGCVYLSHLSLQRPLCLRYLFPRPYFPSFTCRVPGLFWLRPGLYLSIPIIHFHSAVRRDFPRNKLDANENVLLCCPSIIGHRSSSVTQAHHFRPRQ